MEITPPLATRPQQLHISELADNWAAWGYHEEQHHLILVAFFESWRTVRRITSAEYGRLAKVLNEHYRQAVFPPDAKDNPYIYWLAGPRRLPQHSFIDSHEAFNQRYLNQFGPLFDVADWLNEFRHDSKRAIDKLQRARAAQNLAANPNAPKRLTHGEAGALGGRGHKASDISKCNELSRGNAAAYRVAKLKEAYPEIAARLATGEFRSVAEAERAAQGITEGLFKLRQAWRRATQEERNKHWAEIKKEMED